MFYSLLLLSNITLERYLHLLWGLVFLLILIGILISRKEQKKRASIQTKKWEDLVKEVRKKGLREEQRKKLKNLIESEEEDKTNKIVYKIVYYSFLIFILISPLIAFVTLIYPNFPKDTQDFIKLFIIFLFWYITVGNFFKNRSKIEEKLKKAKTEGMKKIEEALLKQAMRPTELSPTEMKEIEEKIKSYILLFVILIIVLLYLLIK